MDALVMDNSLASFRERVRDFLATHAERAGDDEEQGRSADEVDADTLARARTFQQALSDAGLVGISWPTECGGQGLDGAFESVWREEATQYELPSHVFNVGMGMCGPTIVRHGTEWQRERFLPPLLRGDEIWAQLFSEPSAGSDLASVTTKGRRQDDGTWLVNGQKVWTSGGRISAYGLALVRTDPSVPKHKGLTMFIIDMKSQGVDVRPLRQMTGRSKFDEVFLTDVVVADEMRIGEIGDGWRCARTTLTSERGAVGRNTAQRGGSYRMLHEAAETAARTQDPVIRQRLAEIYSNERISGWFAARAREARLSDRPDRVSILGKLHATSQIRRTSRLAVELIGPASVAWPTDDDNADQWALRLCAGVGLSIGGGTDEIVKNSVSEAVLGLPREPSTDRDVPFDELVRSGLA